MKNVMLVMLVACLAAPAFAYTEWDNGGGDGLWSNPLNWLYDAVPGIEKTALGELNYPSPSENIVTLNTTTNDLEVFEVYGGGTLNIVAGGVLTVIDQGDAEFKIYTGGNGDGDLGSSINLLGGSIVIQDGVDVQLGDPNDGLFGEDGKTIAQGGVVVDTETMAGYTIYTSTAAARFDFDPTPANDATVVVADSLALSWLNLPEPNNVADPVWVDVYWDTDEFGENATTQVLTESPDALTVDVSALEIGTYYWRIDATDPDTGGDPYVMETAVYSLITVDACQAAKDAEPPYTEINAREIGDTNYDCIVDLADLAALAENWQASESY